MDPEKMRRTNIKMRAYGGVAIGSALVVAALIAVRSEPRAALLSFLVGVATVAFFWQYRSGR